MNKSMAQSNTEENRFENRYVTGDLPWNISRPDYNLINVVTTEKIKPGKALDIGCGTGDNAIWLVNQKFNVTGIDYSVNAIKMAKENARKNGFKNIKFSVVDILKDKIPDGPYDFIFDRGCFHSFDLAEERITYANKVAKTLKKDGLWLSLIGNYDDGRLDQGPPKRTVRDISNAVEPYFEIQYIRSGRFDSNDDEPSKIWIGLFKKR
jgi:ubiquinone/menaquinone biosynthesis C-methylase UbiE